jgi:hypothetical protein
MLKTLFALLTALISALTAFSQETDVFPPDSVKKEIRAIPISGSLHIDGLLMEPEWSLAAPSPHFIQIEPAQGKPANFETQVKVLYNRQFLYVGVIAKDSLGKKAIMATDFMRDFDYLRHDLISLAFDGFNDRRNAMSFVTNAYGVQRDLLSFDDLYYDLDWDGLWKVRTNRTDSGWTAEFAIPWKTLRYPKSADSIQSWGFNIYRNRRLTNEISALSEFPRVFTSLRMNYAGRLTNLRPPPPKANIRIQPYVLSSFDHYKNYDPLIKSSQTHVKAGGDLKWAINPNSVLDLTTNTDFAQADADLQVNNVSRFSVFFPEKRQFFLENASLFGIGIGQSADAAGGTMRIQPFFSRSIGLDTNGSPIPIDAGGRYVHRSDKLNYGAILIRQREMPDMPGTNFFVGRVSENFGKENRVGLLSTIKNNRDGSNIGTTADGFFRISDAQSLNTMLVHTYSSKTGKQGFSGFAQYYYITNHFKIWWTQSLVTRDFNPEMGFVSRKDVIGTTPGIFYYYRGKQLPLKKILLAWEPSISPEFYHQASTGKLIESSFTTYPLWLNFKSGAYFGYGFIPSYQHLTEPFDPLGVTISPGEYHYTRHQIWGSTNPSKIVNLQLLYTWGAYFNGRLNSADWKLQFAPIPNISLTGELNRNRFIGVGENKTHSTVDLYIIQGRFALNPRVQLIGFYQKNSGNRSQNYNIRFSWEYEPLSYIYVIYNHIEFTNPAGRNPAEDHVIAKISYLKQF